MLEVKVYLYAFSGRTYGTRLSLPDAEPTIPITQQRELVREYLEKQKLEEDNHILCGRVMLDCEFVESFLVLGDNEPIREGLHDVGEAPVW